MRSLTRHFVLAVAVLGLMVGAAGRAEAGLVFYTSESTFNAAAPVLSTQTFASATIAGIGISVIANPLLSFR
jgi:hypothetical protein